MALDDGPGSALAMSGFWYVLVGIQGKLKKALCVSETADQNSKADLSEKRMLAI